MTPDDLKGLSESLGAAKDYADAIVKPPLEQLGGLLADTVGYWRLKNRVRLLLKAKQYVEESGVEPAKLLPNVFVPLIEEAGNTDDETLADMFARLLATHLDTEQAGKVHPSFAKTLGQLSPLDVRILRLIDQKDERTQVLFKENVRRQKVGEPRIPDEYLSPFEIVAEARRRWNVIADHAYLSLANLERLGLVKEPTWTPKTELVHDQGSFCASEPGTTGRGISPLSAPLLESATSGGSRLTTPVDMH